MNEEHLPQNSRQGPSLKVAIIGLSQSPGLLRELQGSSFQVVAVADLDVRQHVLMEAQGQGIQVSQDYTEILERADLDLILNLIPDKTVEAIIHQLKPDRAQVINDSVLSFLQAFSREFILRRTTVEILADVSRVLSGFLDQSTYLARLLQKVSEVTGARAAGLWIKKGEGFVLLKGMALPPPLQGYNPAKGGRGLVDRLLEERTVLWIGDISSDPRIQDSGPVLDAGLRGVMVLPLIREFEVRGVLLLFHAEGATFSRDLVSILRVITEFLAQILEREGTIQGARDLLIRDELTGLYNDVYFMDRLPAEIKRANRNESPFSLLYLTLRSDRAMEYADQMMIRPYLRAIAADLMASLRHVDVPARYKQNDFIVILPDTAPSDALVIAERLAERLSTVRLEGIGERAVKFSIGVASYPTHAQQPKELLDNAELAAFLAGRDGHNRIRLFPTGRMELNGLTPEGIVRKYPMLSELFQVLAAQGARDHRTFIHAQEVAFYASLIGRELALSPDRVMELGLAGWLHDIGKMTLSGIDNGLQERLSRLPALNERIHPAIGAYILKNLTRSAPVLKGVLHHHARYDGAGQSSGLKGQAIPLEGRIIAVADAYQRLQSGQGGQQAPSQRDMFLSLRTKASRELDPQVVECLIRGVAAG